MKFNGNGQRAPLSSILPKEEICRCFNQELKFHEYTMEDLDSVSQMKPYILSGLSMSVCSGIGQPGNGRVSYCRESGWVSMKTSGVDTVSSVGSEGGIIRDMYYVKAVIDEPLLSDLKVAELLVAIVDPSSLYLADFDFSMMPETRMGTAFVLTTKWYLGVLHKMIDNAVVYGKSQGCSHLLMNARRSQYIDIFLKRGFLMEEPQSDNHLVGPGLGIPMVRQL